MIAWVSQLDGLDRLLLIVAAVGGLMFLVQIVMMLVGGLGHASGDVDLDLGDGGSSLDGAGDADIGHAGADISFKLLSLQGMSAFLMMFGLIGLALRLSNHAGVLLALGGGALGGGATVWLIDRIFRMFSKLQHSGTIDMRHAIGQEGSVYLTIPGKEPGKVRLDVQGRMRVLDAVSADGARLGVDTRVKVTALGANGLLIVAPL